MSSRRPRTSKAGGLPAGVIAWAATLLAALSSATAVGLASVGVLSDALDVAVADQLASQAGLTASSVAGLPLDAIVLLGGDRTSTDVRARLDDLARGGRLHDVAVVRAADGTEIGRDGARRFVAAGADADLIALAAAGAVEVGPQYRGVDGAWYRAAYAPIPGQVGWVAAIEGSDATLGAIGRLRRTQIGAGIVALASAGALATGAAAVIARPLRRFEADLARATPSTAERIVIQGPREVRTAAASARSLLDGIRSRDLALARANAERLQEIQALAAAVAHEVRNPLHALGMTIERLSGAEGERQIELLARTRERVSEIDDIVERFLDLSRPIAVHAFDADLRSLAREVAGETDGLLVDVVGSGRGVADPSLVRQILRNLLRNAREAGASHATVALSAGDVDVSDDGSGVPSELGDRVFLWFSSGRASGTGLGLAASRRAARAQGGDLVLVSARPARFRLTLPTEVRREG